MINIPNYIFVVKWVSKLIFVLFVYADDMAIHWPIFEELMTKLCGFICHFLLEIELFTKLYVEKKTNFFSSPKC